MFDVSSASTFARLETWLEELDTYSTKNNIVKMIVGNKIDVVRLLILVIELCVNCWHRNIGK